NYSSDTSATATADITARNLTITAHGIDRMYDGTTSAGITFSDDRISGDDLSIGGATASFANSHAGVSKPVSVTGIVVTGSDINNYVYSNSTTTTATISPRALNIVATAADKVYDGTRT